jgi:diaminopimelate decarboxylase
MKVTELFQQEGNSILFDGKNIEKIVEKHGSPIYIFSEKKLLENIDYMQKIFQKYWSDTIIAYSMKNNSIPEVNTIIAKKLSLFEVSSLAELHLVNKISKEEDKALDVIATNIYKPDNLIIETLKNNKNLFAIDSFQDLKNIERIATKTKQKPRVLIRVNPGIKMDSSKEIFASAYPASKCASIINDIDKIKEISNDPTISLWLPTRDKKPHLDSAENLVIEASKSKYIDLVGLHCHLGSQISQLEYFDRFFEVTSIFYMLMNEKIGNKLEILDFGGGYPIDYLNDGRVPSLNAISQSLAKNLSKAKIQPRIIIESGRFITATAATLISSVKLTKESSTGGNIAVLDLSLYTDLLDVLVANWFYDCTLVNNLPEKDENKINWTLVGITNDALDQFRISTPGKQFPRDLAVNDIIAIKNTGAYTSCFNSTYSGKPITKKLVIPI